MRDLSLAFTRGDMACDVEHHHGTRSLARDRATRSASELIRLGRPWHFAQVGRCTGCTVHCGLGQVAMTNQRCHIA
jgi:hypothetical protein